MRDGASLGDLTCRRGRLRHRRQRRGWQRRGGGAGGVGGQGGGDRGGGHYTRRDFNMQEAWAYPALYQEHGNRATDDLAIMILQGRSVGGGTTVNWTSSFRTPERTLKLWAERHGVRGVDAATLAPHFEAVEARLDIGPGNPDDVNANNRKLWEGLPRRGFGPELISPQREGVRASRVLRDGLPARRQTDLPHHVPGRRGGGRRRRLCRLSGQAGGDRQGAGPRRHRRRARSRDPLAARAAGRARPARRRAGSRGDQHPGAAAALADRHRQRRRRQADLPAPDGADDRLPRPADRGVRRPAPAAWSTTLPTGARVSATSWRRCWCTPCSARSPSRGRGEPPRDRRAARLRRGDDRAARGRLRRRRGGDRRLHPRRPDHPAPPACAGAGRGGPRRAGQHGPHPASAGARGDDTPRDAIVIRSEADVAASPTRRSNQAATPSSPPTRWGAARWARIRDGPWSIPRVAHEFENLWIADGVGFPDVAGVDRSSPSKPWPGCSRTTSFKPLEGSAPRAGRAS